MSDYIVGSRQPKPGEKVFIIQKKDYGTSNYVEGTVKDVLTSRPNHPRGHKVRLENGIIGRVQKFADQKDAKPIQPKYEERNTSQPQINTPSILPTDPEDLV